MENTRQTDTVENELAEQIRYEPRIPYDLKEDERVGHEMAMARYYRFAEKVRAHYASFRMGKTATASDFLRMRENPVNN